MCPQYAAIKPGTRVCALHCHLADVFWRMLQGYPIYVSNRAWALSSSSPFHYVIAKILPAVQLTTHARSNIFNGRPQGHTSKVFRLLGLLLFRIIVGLRCVRCELRYYCMHAKFIVLRPRLTHNSALMFQKNLFQQSKGSIYSMCGLTVF